MNGTPGTRLYLVRHGRTDWNDQGRHQGQADPPLNAQGHRQAEAVAEALASVPFDALYSSDLARARQTAEALARRLGLPVRLDRRLRELAQGAWEGLPATEIAARYPDLFALWRTAPSRVRPPGGETLEELLTRVTAALDEIAARHPGGQVAVFTHKLPIAVTLCRLQGLPLDRFWDQIPENGAWVVLEWWGKGEGRILQVGEVGRGRVDEGV